MTHILFSRFGKMYVYVFIYYLVTMYIITALLLLKYFVII